MIYEFMATQSFNGYDKPWPGGTGNNLLDIKNPLFSGINAQSFTTYASEVVNDVFISGGQAGKNEGSSLSVAMDPSAVFSVSADVHGTVSSGKFSYNIRGATFGESGIWGTYNTIRSSNIPFGNNIKIENITFPASDYDYAVLCIYGGAPKSVDASHIMVNLGETALPWEPYANVCMPEGFNMWDPENQEYIQVYAGYVNANTRELYLRPVYKEYAGEELVGPWMSSLDLYEEDTTPTEGAFVIDFGGELTSYEITPYMLQTLLESMGIRQHFTDGASLLNKLMDQAQGRVRSEEELLHLSRPLNVIAIGDQLPAGLTFKPISKDVLPGLPGKFIR